MLAPSGRVNAAKSRTREYEPCSIPSRRPLKPSIPKHCGCPGSPRSSSTSSSHSLKHSTSPSQCCWPMLAPSRWSFRLRAASYIQRVEPHPWTKSAIYRPAHRRRLRSHRDRSRGQDRTDDGEFLGSRYATDAWLLDRRECCSHCLQQSVTDSQ